MRAARKEQLPGSFRDPSGFLFQRGATLCRQVNITYKEAYDRLMQSGLYQALVDAGLLLPHEETDIEAPRPELAYRIIQPEPIPFISYPYSWCFSQLKDAALTTIHFQKTCLDFGMSLKDCSAYNIQFRNGRPIFIDTLSFEQYREGEPWVAYRQFCQHFLAPLALMASRDIRLNQLLRIYIDGVPLDLASSLLPFRTRLTFSLLSHIHLHAQSQKRFAKRHVDVGKYTISRSSLLGFIDNLESTVKKLEWKPRGTPWAEYDENASYSPEAFLHKKQLVDAYLGRIKPALVWDLGANAGAFSRLASARGIPTISFDIDPAAVEKNYLECRATGETRILPLVLDLTNPSPAIGWNNEERMSLGERGPTETILALALIHHLAISNNVPLSHIAQYLADLCRSLIVEFVPKTDARVQGLLASRRDIFPGYTQQAFEADFGRHFTIEDSSNIRNSQRILYLMRRIRG